MSQLLPTYTVRGQTAFWRTYSLTIDAGNGAALKFGNTEAGSAALRIAFSIERNFSGPGPRNLVLYNLTPKTRAILKKGSRVTIMAGYNNTLGTICIGSVLKVKTERSGPDTTTTMELIDSESFSRGCSIQKSYAAAVQVPGKKTFTGGVLLTQVLTDIAQAMQLNYDPKRPIVVRGGVALGIQNPRFLAGLVLNHTCGDALDMLLKPQNLEWTIDNGALSIVPIDSYNGSPVFVLTKKTGLINTPSLNEREHVLFQALMNPQIQPNTLVNINVPQPSLYTQVSSNPTGYYKIIKTVHRGDTHGGAWDVACEAESYAGDFNVLKVATGNNFAQAVIP